MPGGVAPTLTWRRVEGAVRYRVYRTNRPDEDKSEVRLLSEGRRTTRFSVPILMTYDAPADGATTNFVLLDLWLVSLLRYARDGGERRWRILRFFEWSSGVGELDE